MAERGQFACDDSETAAPMHAGEFPGPYTVRKNYLARHDGATWRLTELSNVVAYACRHSPTRIDIGIVRFAVVAPSFTDTSVT